MTAVIFGDVHGNSTALQRLVDYVKPRYPDTEFYSVGDLIDRGPDSRGVLDICVRENVKGILGNHELWLCSVLSGHPMDDMPYAKIMGGLATLSSYGLYRGDPDRVGPAIRATVPKAQKDFLLGLPPYRVVTVGSKSYLLTHTGVNSGHAQQLRELAPDLTDEQLVSVLVSSSPDTFFWLSTHPHQPSRVAQFASFTQVFGHTPVPDVISYPGHYFALDTGSGTCAPFKLSAVILTEDGKEQLISV